jgi:hypothetical protein
MLSGAWSGETRLRRRRRFALDAALAKPVSRASLIVAGFLASAPPAGDEAPSAGALRRYAFFAASSGASAGDGDGDAVEDRRDRRAGEREAAGDA